MLKLFPLNGKELKMSMSLEKSANTGPSIVPYDQQKTEQPRSTVQRRNDNTIEQHSDASPSKDKTCCLKCWMYIKDAISSFWNWLCSLCSSKKSSKENASEQNENINKQTSSSKDTLYEHGLDEQASILTDGIDEEIPIPTKRIDEHCDVLLQRMASRMQNRYHSIQNDDDNSCKRYLFDLNRLLPWMIKLQKESSPEKAFTTLSKIVKLLENPVPADVPEESQVKQIIQRISSRSGPNSLFSILEDLEDKSIGKALIKYVNKIKDENGWSKI